MLSLLAVCMLTLNLFALDLAITGTGTTQTQNSQNTSFGTELRLEQFVAKNCSIGFVQGINVATPNTRGTSELFTTYNVDYTLFGLKNQVYLGGDGRVGYGNGDIAWSVGPLAGNRLFLKDNVYILTQVNYDIGLNHNIDNSVRYSIGLGVRF
jgi:hypothetical protein